MNLIDTRKEHFVQWMTWAIDNEDCDPSLYMLNYLFDRFEHNIEQRLYICWLYGTTYYAPTSWVIWHEFPDCELVDLDRLDAWNSENYKRLRYQTDTKYNKGFLPQQFKSYREWLDGKQQSSRILSLMGDNEVQSYTNLMNEIQSKLYKFGRYTTWFYLQTLKQCAGVPIEAPNLLLSDDGSKSHRKGLLFALGMDDRLDEKFSKTEYDSLEAQGAELLAEVLRRVKPRNARKVDFFAMETCLCSFKKLFRTKEGRYLGYYIDRQGEEIARVEADGWDGIYWKPLWDARKETLDPLLVANDPKPQIDKSKFSLYLEHREILTPDRQLVGLESFFGE